MTDAQREELRRLAEIREELLVRSLSQAKAERDEAREAIAAWMMQHSYATGHGDTVADLLSELEWQHEERAAALAAALAKVTIQRDGFAAAISAISAEAATRVEAVANESGRIQQRADALAAENALLRGALEQQRQWHGRQPFEYRHQPQIDLIDAALKGAATP